MVAPAAVLRVRWAAGQGAGQRYDGQQDEEQASHGRAKRSSGWFLRRSVSARSRELGLNETPRSVVDAGRLPCGLAMSSIFAI
jgi:hypothetical protein